MARKNSENLNNGLPGANIAIGKPFWGGLSTGSADAYVASAIRPKPAALADGLRVTLKIHAANTGATTLAVSLASGSNSAAKTVKNGGTTDLSANDLLASAVYDFVYDGTSDVFRLVR